ncbi:MAG: DUF72 domain-containing protein [Nitrososphaeraceae archaeon]
MGDLLLGCSGWNYGHTPENGGGWTGVFYPDANTKRLRYYSQFFNTAEIDSTFYEKFYTNMTKGTFIGMSKATPEKFQFSVKVPETITHIKRLRTELGAFSDFEEFLEKISPLNKANKLGAVLFQLPPSFTVSEFKNVERFLDELPKSASASASNLSSSSSLSSPPSTKKTAISNAYHYAVEFRHPSWKTEGPWELLKHYDIATVLTDSPARENLGFLSEVTVTADHSFIRFHGRNEKGHYWYNYLYSKEELKPWVDKVAKLKEQTKILRIYFNNHYGGKAVVNALQFKEMNSMAMSQEGRRALQHAQSYLSKMYK